MNILLTSAFKYTEEQLNKINSLGFNITSVSDERIPLKIDVSLIDIVVCNQLFLYNDISKFKNLKFIQLTSVGLERVPLEYTKKHNILVLNAGKTYAIPISEWVILKILEIYKSSRKFFEQQNSKIWEKDRTLLELTDKKVLIAGFGNIGQEIARRLKPFGVYIVAMDKRKLKPEEENLVDKVCTPVEIDNILKSIDILILTLPFTAETRNIINRDRIFDMKKGSIIVNPARGKLLDEKALLEALDAGIIYGAALDVFQKEPLPQESPLWNMKNVIITPHNSFVSDMINKRLFELIYSNLKREITKHGCVKNM